MKVECIKAILSLAFLLFVQFGMGQHERKKVPVEVEKSFHVDFPEAKNPQWQKTHRHWAAYFYDRSPKQRGEMIAYYDQSGKMIDAHIPFDEKDVPPFVIKQLQKKYNGSDNYRFTKIVPHHTNGFFEVWIHYDGQEKRVCIDELGQERIYDDMH